jgi:hypothetical protein
VATEMYYKDFYYNELMKLKEMLQLEEYELVKSTL